MSYAKVAKSNIPEGEMPKPDPSLADGHFAGETGAHPLHQDEKINVLPAGTDLEHPPIEEPHHKATPPQVHRAGESKPEVSHALNVAPEPELVPVDKEKWERRASNAGEAVKDGAKKVEKKSKELGDKAAKKTNELSASADKAARDVSREAKEVGRDVRDTAKAAGREVRDEAKDLGRKAKAELNEVETKLEPYWEKTKDIILRPGTLGGLMGVVNVGLLGTLGYYAYTRRDQPWDQRIVASAVAGTLGLFGAEGYVTESYLNTPEGRAEAERAKREGSRAYMQAKEVVLRPGVFGGLAGALNVAVIGTVSYFSYKHWNHRWDPRVVSGVTAGLVALSGLEGYAGKAYADNELPKRR